MATPIAINKDPNHKNPRLEFPIKPHTNSNSYHSHHSHSHAHSPSFLLHNGFNSADLPDFDIEMITIPSVTYTSLKDLLPSSSSSSSSPPSAITPAMMKMINSSWYDEIPLKDPLLKHAALAYLQPMSTPREVRRKGIFGRLKDRCTCCGCDDGGCGGGFLGCFSWINDVVFAGVKDVFFCERRRRRSVVAVEEEEEEEEYDEEDEDDDDVVVDDEKID